MKLDLYDRAFNLGGNDHVEDYSVELNVALSDITNQLIKSNGIPKDDQPKSNDNICRKRKRKTSTKIEVCAAAEKSSNLENSSNVENNQEICSRAVKNQRNSINNRLVDQVFTAMYKFIQSCGDRPSTLGDAEEPEEESENRSHAQRGPVRIGGRKRRGRIWKLISAQQS